MAKDAELTQCYCPICCRRHEEEPPPGRRADDLGPQYEGMLVLACTACLVQQLPKGEARNRGVEEVR